MNFSLHPELHGERVTLYSLQAPDFDAVYGAANDPEVWAQHPNKDRWKKEVFQTFFEGALQSGGAFKIVDNHSGKVIGSTRFYDYDAEEKTILIGYTFFAKAFWGKGYNKAVKQLMLDYAFQFADRVLLHIGAQNFRSQISISRLGARKIGEEEVAYYGEPPKLNFVYEIKKADWEYLQQTPDA